MDENSHQQDNTMITEPLMSISLECQIDPNDEEAITSPQDNEQFTDNPPHESSPDTSRITGTRRLIKLAGPHSHYIFIGFIVLLNNKN